MIEHVQKKTVKLITALFFGGIWQQM